MINFKIFSYFLSLTIVIAIIAYLVIGSSLAIPLASAVSLLWIVQDEIKNRRLNWPQMLLYALFLSIIITIIAAINTDDWSSILPYIIAGSFLFALDNKIKQSGSKRIKLICDIVGYALIAGVIIYWYLNRGLDAGLIGFTAGLVIKGIKDFRESYGKNDLNQAIDTSPNA